jgi:hypothetical protein
MIIDTSHCNKDISILINDLVGSPFSLLKTIKMRGTGSKRMIIEDSSPNMKPYLNTAFDATYSHIELRPLGILISIIRGLGKFIWVIPYNQLVIYKNNCSTVYAQGRYIHFRANQNFRDNKDFFDKLFRVKAKYERNCNVLHFK